jgi:hypothetical protein
MSIPEQNKIIERLRQHKPDFTDTDQAMSEYFILRSSLMRIIEAQNKALNVATDFLVALGSIEQYRNYGDLARTRLDEIDNLLKNGEKSYGT